MCEESACLIVKDSGLPAGFTIAHELGHVLVGFSYFVIFIEEPSHLHSSNELCKK